LGEKSQKDDTKKEKKKEKILSLNLFKKKNIWKNNLRLIFFGCCEAFLYYICDIVIHV